MAATSARTSALGASQSTLPQDVIDATGNRLKLTTLIVGGAFLFYDVMYWTVWSDYTHPVGMTMGIVGVVLSIAVYLLLRYGCVTRRSVAITGMAYEILICLNLALTEYCVLDIRNDAPSTQISWACVVIVIFPFLIPSKPKRVLLSATISASMIPVAYWIAISLGYQDPLGVDAALGLFIPGYVCAVIAYFPSRVIAKLGAEVNKARQLGSYRLEKRIGQGGMGEVWLAKHNFLARPAAIKLVKAEALSESGSRDRELMMQRFEREAQATALLQSPNTVELYDFGVADSGDLYYVMELLSGEDLETLVRDHGPVPLQRSIAILLQVCDSLAEAHAAELTHRDIKPANVFLAKRSRDYDVVKVLDFGLVKASANVQEDDLHQTSKATIQGTPAYLAPEAITSEDPIDGRADLYALGCVWYWLLTGKLVFDGKSAMEVAVAHATQEPPRLGESIEGLPESAEAVFQKLLRKDPEERFADADQLASALAAIEVEPWTQAQARQWWSEHPMNKTRNQAKPTTPTILVPNPH